MTLNKYVVSLSFIDAFFIFIRSHEVWAFQKEIFAKKGN